MRGVAGAQADRDLDVHKNVLRKWIREAKASKRLRSLMADQGITCSMRRSVNVWDNAAM
ncbi:transposase-like protein [Ancylobacter vacuolatus]|uniref:Transposase-like protein n=1 Tax=Ancylobacter vacuolatus TaxID=223389 RepID=A0ABU0DPE1_9HYPH|nr:transposase-like protein [Ancylobacter vacuolatus]